MITQGLPVGLLAQGGAAPYAPGWMTLDGTTGYWRKTGMVTSGNKYTFIARFNIASFTGPTAQMYLGQVYGPSQQILQIVAFSSDNAVASRRDRIRVIPVSTAAAALGLLWSSTALCDGNDHLLFVSGDHDAGSMIYRVDGNDEDDTGNAERIAPITGTLDSGATTGLTVGANLTPAAYLGGKMGYFGFDDSYRTNYGDFSTGAAPKQLDTSGWTEWGSQPLVFQDECNLSVQNLGSAGLFTKNGTITGPA